jgi:MoaA/NifB/PqqE/SkfB family radical SAM enzyme
MKTDNRIDFFIVKKCLNHCVFCSEKPKLTGSELPLSKIKKVLSEERKKGAQLVHLVGGEPTLHSQFPRVLKLTKSLGYNIFIITNVIMFSSAKFCEETLPYLDEIMVSIHGPNAKIHNANTQNPRAFKKVMAGLKNLKKYFKKRLEATSAITKINFRHLTEIAKLIDRFGIKEYQCMSVVPQGSGRTNFLTITPTLTELKPEINKVIDFCENKNIKIRFSGLPMCLLGKKYIYSHDLWEGFKITDTLSGQDKIKLWKEPGANTDFAIDIGRIKTAKCRKCLKSGICGGVYRIYYQKYGDKELNPFC